MSNVDAIEKLFTSSLENDEVAFIYLGYSGVIMRTSKRVILIDPANLLKDDEVNSLEGVDLLLFTHGHGDHYNPDVTLAIFKATHTPILAEPTVARDLNGKVPPNKLTAAMPGKAYVFGEISVNAVQGIHRGSINLYQIKLGELNAFHGGDSGYVQVTDYPSDLVFLPTGSPSPTASPEYAFNMALELKPSVAVAIHGSTDQSKEFEAKMKEMMPKTSVIIAEPYVTKIMTPKKG